MKKLQLLFYLFLSIAVVPLTSCDDDDDDDFVEPSRMELLTQKEWTGMAFYAGGMDFTEFMRDSANFDITKWKIKFNNDGSAVSKYEGTPDEEGEWRFANSEQDIILSSINDVGGQEIDTISIARLTSTELYLDQTWEVQDTSGAVIEIDMEMRFGH